MVDATTAPNRSIVRITVRLGPVTYQGSGVLIANDEVLTAAHLVYAQGIGVATNVRVSPAYDAGLTPFGTIDGTVTHYNPISVTDNLLTVDDIQADFALIHLDTPTNAGFLPLGETLQGGQVTISGYPTTAAGHQVATPQSVTQVPGTTILLGTQLGPGSSGGPVWTGEPTNAAIVALVSAGSTTTDAGYFKQLTANDRATIQSWVDDDHATPPIAGYVDAITGDAGTLALTPANGGPTYLQWSYIWPGSNGVALSTSAPNTFLHGGPGQDSIQVTAGQNVLDGGLGSNFLTGGSGIDTFFTDARAPGTVWNTLRNFHQGDSATLWGFVPGQSSYRWEPAIDGAEGSQGATLRANIVGGTGRTGDSIDASITFSGLSVAQAQALTIDTGTQPAGTYLSFYNPGV